MNFGIRMAGDGMTVVIWLRGTRHYRLITRDSIYGWRLRGYDSVDWHEARINAIQDITAQALGLTSYGVFPACASH